MCQKTEDTRRKIKDSLNLQGSRGIQDEFNSEQREEERHNTKVETPGQNRNHK